MKSELVMRLDQCESEGDHDLEARLDRVLEADVPAEVPVHLDDQQALLQLDVARPPYGQEIQHKDYSRSQVYPDTGCMSENGNIKKDRNNT